MDWTTILATLWTALNSQAGIMAMASVLIWTLNKLYASKPLWQQYEGAIIAGVKFAEKEIPDDTANKGLARLDAALKYVLKVYESSQRRKATAAEVADLTNGIQVTHAQLESAQCLGSHSREGCGQGGACVLSRDGSASAGDTFPHGTL